MDLTTACYFCHRSEP